MPKINYRKCIITLDDTDIRYVIKSLQASESQLINNINESGIHLTDDDRHVDLYMYQRLIDMFNYLNNVDFEQKKFF